MKCNKATIIDILYVYDYDTRERQIYQISKCSCKAVWSTETDLLSTDQLHIINPETPGFGEIKPRGFWVEKCPRSPAPRGSAGNPGV